MLHEGAFTFDSTSLEWLVVTINGKAAAKAIRCGGRAAGYGFVTYGFHDPEALRLVPWTLVGGSYPGDKILYDNRRDSHYDVDLSNLQVLVGGSVQVHRLRRLQISKGQVCPLWLGVSA